jgi:hypothetical protein
MARKPGRPSPKEERMFKAVVATPVVVAAAGVITTWFLTRNLTDTMFAVAGGVFFVPVAIAMMAIAIDRFRRGRIGSLNLAKLQSKDATVRLEGVDGLGWLGRDAAAIIGDLGYQGVRAAFGSANAHRELRKYALPGLGIAVRDKDSLVRAAAVRWLREIGTVEAIAIAEHVSSLGVVRR